MPDYSHWYYILGWFIGVTLHNWPVMIAMMASAYAAWKLYWRPTRRNMQWLYGWVLLVFGYEYIKHLGTYLAEPVRFLFTTNWAWMQPGGRILIELVVPCIINFLGLMFLLSALGRLNNRQPAAVRDDGHNIVEPNR
jgi:hypothetical protein